MGLFDEIDRDNLSDDDRAWLKSWNQEVPEDTEMGQEPTQEPSETPKPSEDTPADADGQEGQSGDDEDDGEDEPYEVWTAEELGDELARRGLPKSGKKQELIERLEADDAAKQ